MVREKLPGQDQGKRAVVRVLEDGGGGVQEDDRSIATRFVRPVSRLSDQTRKPWRSGKDDPKGTGWT